MDRPFVHVNCAATADGKIARPDGSRLRISDEWDMKRVHRLRAGYGAIMVGAGTIITDDPKLTVKESYVPDPPALSKVVLDGIGRIPVRSRFLETPGPSYIFTTKGSDPEWRKGIAAGNRNGEIRIISLDSENSVIPIDRIMSSLSEVGIGSILVEGGSRVIGSVLESGMFDIFTVYVGPMLMGGNGPSISLGSGKLDDPSILKLTNTMVTPGGGILLEYRPQ